MHDEESSMDELEQPTAEDADLEQESMGIDPQTNLDGFTEAQQE